MTCLHEETFIWNTLCFQKGMNEITFISILFGARLSHSNDSSYFPLLLTMFRHFKLQLQDSNHEKYHRCI